MVAAPIATLEQFKLGKKAPRHDPRTLKAERYIDLAVFKGYPKTQKWDAGISDFGMMLNNEHGDCVVAGAGHAIQIMTANNGQEVTVSDADVLKGYEDVGHYVPGDPSTDNGTVMLDFLNYWRTVGLGGHKIGGFAAFNPQNSAMAKAVIELFGFAYIGIALPKSAQNQRVWSVTRGADARPNSWGGHCVTVPNYTSTTNTCVTWARLLAMTNGFFTRYVDEGYAVFSEEWLNASGVAPNGVNRDQLLKDLQMVTA